MEFFWLEWWPPAVVSPGHEQRGLTEGPAHRPSGGRPPEGGLIHSDVPGASHCEAPGWLQTQRWVRRALPAELTVRQSSSTRTQVP